MEMPDGPPVIAGRRGRNQQVKILPRWPRQAVI